MAEAVEIEAGWWDFSKRQTQSLIEGAEKNKGQTESSKAVNSAKHPFAQETCNLQRGQRQFNSSKLSSWNRGGQGKPKEEHCQDQHIKHNQQPGIEVDTQQKRHKVRQWIGRNCGQLCSIFCSSVKQNS